MFCRIKTVSASFKHHRSPTNMPSCEIKSNGIRSDYPVINKIKSWITKIWSTEMRPFYSTKQIFLRTSWQQQNFCCLVYGRKRANKILFNFDDCNFSNRNLWIWFKFQIWALPFTADYRIFQKFDITLFAVLQVWGFHNVRIDEFFQVICHWGSNSDPSKPE